MTVLEVKNLQKSFGAIRAVQDISFSVKAGEVFTIIGPNGAGKTTTLVRCFIKARQLQQTDNQKSVSWPIRQLTLF